MDKEYFVFISYSSDDKEWAVWLRYELEHYHLPASFNGRTDVRDNLRKVFRDRDEFCAGPEWDEQAHKALENTNNLIVICSPHSAKSDAVNKEIESFIALGKEDHIFPFIVEGEKPEDCFPPALRQSKLGGDVNKDGGRDSAFIKVVAGMLKVSFPSLWNRYEIEKAEEERKQREQRDSLLRMQSRFLSEKVLDLVNKDEANTAKILALIALPSNLEVPNRPYVPEAEMALRCACSNHSAILHGHSSGCVFASFSPDGKYIVTGSADKTARIWNIRECRQLTILNHDDTVSTDFFDLNGKKIITTSEWGKTINVWDSQTGRQIKTIYGHDKFVHSAVYTHDNNWIISASSDNTIRKWDSKTYKEVLRINEGTKGFRWAFPSPDGRKIISSGFDHSVRIWDAFSGGQIIKLCSGKYDPPYAIYSPDGCQIATAIGNHVLIWDSESYDLIIDIEASEFSVDMLAFSPDGQKLATISSDKVIGIWDARFHHPIKSVRGQLIKKMKGHIMAINSCYFSPDSKQLVTASWDQTIRLWDIDDHIEYRYNQNLCAFSYAEYSPNNKHMAVVYNDNVIRLYDADGFQEEGELIGHKDFPKCVHFSQDGKKLVSSSADSTVRIWDYNAKKCLHTFEFDRNITESRFNPDGKILGIADWGHIYLYNTNNWTLIKDIEVSGVLGTRYLSFCPDGSKLATAQGSKILLYDINTGSLTNSVNVRLSDVSLLQYSPNGDYLYFVSDNTLCRIDTRSLTKVEFFEGHIDVIRRFVFSTDQRFIATASNDKSLRIWDALSCTHLHTCIGHTMGVTSVSFQPDGKTIMSASFDGTFRKWDFPPLQKLIDETSKYYTSCLLTPEERKKYYLD